MDITPLPNISWNRFHYLMTCLFKMLCCMFAYRRVTTTYMTANKTHPKRNYREMFFFTFFTILSIWTNSFFFVCKMFAIFWQIIFSYFCIFQLTQLFLILPHLLNSILKSLLFYLLSLCTLEKNEQFLIYNDLPCS